MQLTGLDTGRVAALGRKNLIFDEKYSLVWRDGVPKGAAKAIEDQLKTTGAQKVQELPDSPSQPHTEGSHEVHARGMHAGEVHAHEVHACEVHAHEVYACEVHAYEVRARGVHAPRDARP
jgi:hypothetical protein